MHYRYANQVCMTVHCYIWHSPDLRNDLSLATELTRNGACAINLSVKVCCEHPPSCGYELAQSQVFRGGSGNQSRED